jgi:molybdopterin molybdotransferase
MARGHGLQTEVTGVRLADALDRALAADLRSPRSIPAEATSMMDGFAVLSADLHKASRLRPVVLRLVGTSFADSRRGPRLGSGETRRVMTGSPLPLGADAVVKREEVAEGHREARFSWPASAGAHVRGPASDIRAGETALSSATLLGPSEIGLAAALGFATISVRQRPRVALLATGDELVAVGSRSRAGIIDSNSLTLGMRLSQMQCVPVPLGIGRDRAGDLRRKLKRGLREDVLITTAGASVGDRDLVKPTLKSLGARFAFERVAMRPGKPVGFARCGRTLVFTLPGNPVSARVTFETLVVPALDALGGRGGRSWPIRPRMAYLARELYRPEGLTAFPRVHLESRGCELWAVPVDKQGSADLTGLAAADALVMLSASGPRRLPKGSRVVVIPL